MLGHGNIDEVHHAEIPVARRQAIFERSGRARCLFIEQMDVVALLATTRRGRAGHVFAQGAA